MFLRLSKLLQWFKQAPAFYAELRATDVVKYQHYVEMVLQAIDIPNNTRWARGLSYDKQLLVIDDDTMERIILGPASADGLSPAYLQVLITQFFLADEVRRMADRKKWVWRVLARSDIDYFPDPWNVRQMLDAAS